MSGRKRFVIVGGGASGVLLAAQLLRSADPALRVALVEKSGAFGRGLAYSTTLDAHVLNVGAHNMSAFADDPDHFRRWLAGRGIEPAPGRPLFAPRRLYGDYLGDIAARLAEREPVRLTLLHGEAVSVARAGPGVTVGLAGGSALEADAAVLAAGHDPQPGNFAFAVRRGEPADTPLPPDAPVLILGAGLSMVDAWLGLKAQGHAGPVFVLSRRGLLPRPHLGALPSPLQDIDVPLGASPARFLRWLRGLARAHEAAGGGWQDALDGLRPFNQRIWQAWSIEERRRFLRHAKAFWDVHRHRLAPQLHARLTKALESGALRLVAGRIGDVRQAPDGLAVSLRKRPTGGRERTETEELRVARIYDCTGVVRDLGAGSLAVVRALIGNGLARTDPLRLGLDVTTQCAVVDASGAASDRIFALGPLTRGVFFEIEAVPDIRVQAAWLAALLTAG